MRYYVAKNKMTKHFQNCNIVSNILIKNLEIIGRKQEWNGNKRDAGRVEVWI